MAHLRKRGRLYYIRYRDAAGKEHEVRTGTASSREANRQLVALQNKLNNDQPVVCRRERLSAVWEAFERVELPHRKESTRRGYKATMARWVDALGPEPVSSLPPARIAAVLADMPLSPDTKRLALARLSGVCSWAVLHGIIPSNPCKGITRPRSRSSSISAISPARAVELLEAVDPRYRMHLSTLYYAGLRVGELRALHATDHHGTRLWVSKSIYKNGAEALELYGVPWWEPKTEQSQRHVHMPRVLWEPLAEWCKSGWGTEAPVLYPPYRLMFPSKSGRPITEHVLRSALADAVETVRSNQEDTTAWLNDPIPEPFTLHSLRAGYARLMLMSGMTLVELRQQMGHQKIETTARYAEWAMTDSPPSVNRADRLVRGI